MLDVKMWLETTGLKVAEECFFKPPSLPYAVFKEIADISGPDNKNCISDRAISIELYSLKVDHVIEKLIENLLNEKAIKYKKDRIWIDSEKMFESIYDFNLIEKI